MDSFYSISKEAICPWELCLVKSLTHWICRKRSFKFSLKGKSPIWQFWIPYPLIHSPHCWCNYHSKASLIMRLICLKLCSGRMQMSYFGGLGHPSSGSSSCFLEVHVGALTHLSCQLPYNTQSFATYYYFPTCSACLWCLVFFITEQLNTPFLNESSSMCETVECFYSQKQYQSFASN